MSSGMQAGEVHDLGYRRYAGPRQGARGRWKVIARRGFRTAIRRPLVVIVLVIGMLPLIVGGVIVWLAAKLGPIISEVAQLKVGRVFAGTALATQIIGSVAALIVGSSVLTDDFRSGALAFYFARPVTRGAYLVGKLVPVVVIVGIVAAAPQILMALEVLVVSGDVATAPLILRALVQGTVATLALCAPAALISAVVRRKMWGAGVYFGIYFGSFVVARVLSDVIGRPELRAFSIGHCIAVLANALYGVRPDFSPVIAAAALTAVAGGALLLAWRLLRRVDILE